MSSTSLHDYLAKQLFIEKNAVTYRSLSRALGIHVNVAKNELANYRDVAVETPATTFQVTGEVPMHVLNDRGGGGSDMDAEDDVDGENVPLVKSVLVGEADLEGVTNQFTRILSVYVYSLSPSPIRDASIICAPTENVRTTDNEKGADFALSVGKVVGAHVQRKGGNNKTPPAFASSSKLKSSAPTLSKPKEDVSTNSKNAEKDKEKPVAKVKGTGKLDFSKAKSKEVKEKESVEVKKGKETKGEKAAPKPSDRKQSSIPERDKKRKSDASTPALSDIETPPSSASSQSRFQVSLKPIPDVKIKRSAVLSDDDDIPQPSRSKGKGIAGADSDGERDVKAMMEVDDDHVIRVSRAPMNERKEEDPVTDQEDAVISDHKETIYKKTRKRKEKKTVPVGRNGLPKRRVVKSRTIQDEKGYMGVEDYSEYESVDEKEAEQEAKKTMTKGDKDSSNVGGSKSRQPSERALSKNKTLKKGGQASLVNFFVTPKASAK